MKTQRSIFLVTSLLLSVPLFIHPQVVTTGVPFLLISPSTEANGMGGIMSSGTPASSSAMMFNPAQLGMMSREYSFSSDFYRNVTSWLPSFNLSDLWLNSYSVIYGMSLDESVPLKPSIGFGFSRVDLNLGEFVRVDEQGNELGRFRGYEYSNNYTIGGSVDVGVQAAMGFTLKQIVSHLSDAGSGQEPGAGEADITAVDIGVVLKAPLYDLLFENNSSTPIHPFADLSWAYAVNNLGGDISYGDPAQADPLPRTMRMGWSAEAGFNITIRDDAFNFLRVATAREAEDLLVSRDAGGWRYNGLIDDMNAYRSMVLSENYGDVSIRRGFSISMLETFTYRQGSYAWNGGLVYKTHGTSISTKGIFRTIGRTMSDENGFNLTKYFLQRQLLLIRPSSSR